MLRRSKKKLQTDEIEQALDVRESMGAEVREILGQEEELDIPIEHKSHKKKSRGYVAVAYFFVLIFISLIGYMIYFNVSLREGVMRSPYNKRQNAMNDFITRGDIVSSDGETLATTQQAGDGTEYRVYPLGRMYAHVIGYDTHGKSGLETVANSDLMTSHDDILTRIKNDFRNRKNMGDTVVATVDSGLQYTAYAYLGDRQGAVVAIDPDTGAVLAMVSKPDFDPNQVRSNWDAIINEEGSSVLVNRATQGRYPPGSTFKVVTSLAYLRKHGLNPNSFSYNCEGEITDGSHTIHCFQGAVHGEENLVDALKNSCNSAYASIGLEVGADALNAAAESVLFNKSLPSAGLPSNASSFNLNRSSGRPLTMQTAIGQGNTLTSPLHMALLASAISNDGEVMTPYIKQEVLSAKGEVINTTSPKKYKKILSSEEATVLKSMMEYTAANAYGPFMGTSYTVGAKTGSADYIKSNGAEATHSWVISFAEKDGKKIAVAVVIEDSGTGLEAAVPVAKSIMDVYYSR